MLNKLSVTNFRCIREATLRLDPANTVIEGENGSGKTSLLEAMFCLSRGRSFRSARRDHAIRYGEGSFTLFGEIASAGRNDRVGLEVGRSGRRIRINGEDVERIGDLARFLPVHLIDPTVHELVEGGPEARRRYLDFGAFHVEQGFLKLWSDYRRALAQRNSALRDGVQDTELAIWERQLVAQSEALAAVRQKHVDGLASRLPEVANALLPDAEVTVEHRPGWALETPLGDLLRAHRERDRQTGITQDGAHRADLRVVFRKRMARHQVSRGQQKLVASALILAQVLEIHGISGRRPLLMLDDPAAELDAGSLGRLLQAAFDVPCQRVLTALDASRLPLPDTGTLFHVKHGDFTLR